MARTNRNTHYAKCMRDVRHANYLKAEEASLEAIVEAGFSPSNRHKSFVSRIVTNYDDLPVAGYKENYTD